MPGYRGHLAGGAIAFCIALVTVAHFTQPTPMALAEWLGFCLAGSLFPDVDTKSKGQKYFYRGILLALIILAYMKHLDILVWVSIISITPMLVNHRGLFHRIWFLIGVPLLLWYVICLQFPCYKGQLFFDVLFFIVGSLSHVWLDVGLRRMLRL